jgi:hypothetical protein
MDRGVRGLRGDLGGEGARVADFQGRGSTGGRFAGEEQPTRGVFRGLKARRWGR